MESVIKWQTGKPKEKGSYLVTISGLDSIYVTCAVYLPDVIGERKKSFLGAK